MKIRALHSPSTSCQSTTTSGSSGNILSRDEPVSRGKRWQWGAKFLKPETSEWLLNRVGTGEKAAIIVVFIILSAAKFVTQDSAYNGSVNPFAGLVFAHVASMLFALTLSFCFEGRDALPKIFCWHASWRLLVMATLFSMATFLTIRAYRTGLWGVAVVLLGYFYMPISVGLSYCVFRREYGKLEWLATAMMVLSTVAFLLVRERCHLADCQVLESWSDSDINALGIVLVLGSVLVSVIASLLSERLYKAQSRGLIRTCGCLHDHSLPVMKVQLDFSSVLVYGALWVVSVSQFGSLVNGPIPPKGWLGDFTLGQCMLVLVTAGHSWLAALVTQRFDTVVRSLVQTLSTVLAICIFDPAQHKFLFSRRWLASLSMAGITVVSALVFQTGRINLKTIRRSLNLPEHPAPPAANEGLGWCDSISSMMVLPIHRSEVSRLSQEALEEGKGRAPVPESDASKKKAAIMRYCFIALKYSSIVLYVLADGFRTVLQSVALSETQNTPAVFVVVINACGLLLANGLTLGSNGFAGLRQSWNWRRVAHFLLCGFFFALTSTLQALAYAMGISPALSMVVGKFYTPMLAILSRWILGKFFLALEWFAIVILTLANLAYGGLQIMGEVDGPDQKAGLWATLVPSLLVLASAASSCINTLLMERLMTGDEKLPSGDSVPFHMQKIRLDAGTVLWSLAFLPAMGLIAHGPGSEKFAFWKERPLTSTCSHLGTCQDGSFVPTDASSMVAGLSCPCGGGFFVGWDTPAMYLALAVNVFYSWITGVVVVRFSSIYRAIADAFSLALVYFILQPLLMNGSWSDTGLNMMALLIPVSALTFSFSANEMHKVMHMVGLGASTENMASKEQVAQDAQDDSENSSAGSMGEDPDGNMSRANSTRSGVLGDEQDEGTSGETRPSRPISEDEDACQVQDATMESRSSSRVAELAEHDGAVIVGHCYNKVAATGVRCDSMASGFEVGGASNVEKLGSMASGLEV